MEREDTAGLTGRRAPDDPRAPGRHEHLAGDDFDAADGRRFAFTLAAGFLGLAGLLVWRGHSTAATVAAAPGILLALAGLIVPGRLGPVWRGWMALARAISKVTTPVVMGLIYYLLITPVGLLRRTFGENPVEPDEREGSYWVGREDGGARTDLQRPF